MLKEKFTDIFRRDKKQKSDEPRKEQITYFDQSYFECKLAYNPRKLSLIKVIANITVGPDAGCPMMVNCKWFWKKQGGSYTSIEGITSSCYQPCIQDVGCSIFVQITPLIQGKVYSGASITKQTGPLELGSALQMQFMEIKNKMYQQNEPAEFSLKIEAVFGKQSELSHLQYPQDGHIVIRKQEDLNFEIEIRTSQFKNFFWITKQFPIIEFIRKSYNSIVISFSEFESMRLAFKQNTDRQILALLLRVLTANSTIDWVSKDQQQIKQNEQIICGLEYQQNKQQQKNEIIEQVKQLQGQKVVVDVCQDVHVVVQENKIGKQTMGLGTDLDLNNCKVKQNQDQVVQQQQQNDLTLTRVSSTKRDASKIIQLQMKVGQLNKQINRIKNQYKDLMKNYNIQKQNKCKIQLQYKKVNQNIKQLLNIKKEKQELFGQVQKMKQDNRFYKNQVAILNKKLKENQAKINEIVHDNENMAVKIKQQEDQTKNHGENMSEILRHESQNWRKLNNELHEQNQELKSHVQKLENNLKTTTKKFESLSLEKSMNDSYPKSMPIIPCSQEPISSDKDKIISNLQFKLSNLEMLLKHRSGEKGNQSMALHKIINNLTEAITEKEQQLQNIRRVNRDLLDKLKRVNV